MSAPVLFTNDMQWRAVVQIITIARFADFVRLLVESGEKVVLCGWHRLETERRHP